MHIMLVSIVKYNPTIFFSFLLPQEAECFMEWQSALQKKGNRCHDSGKL